MAAKVVHTSPLVPSPSVRPPPPRPSSSHDHEAFLRHRHPQRWQHLLISHRKKHRDALMVQVSRRNTVAVAQDAESTGELEDRLKQSWKMLQDFTAQEARGLGASLLSSRSYRHALRDALLTAVKHPWPPANWIPGEEDAGTGILLGIVASDIRLALRSLRDYCDALEVPFVQPESRVSAAAALPLIRGSVYIKYNSKTRQCYAAQYQGRDRGVLVSLGTVQIGHLPLGLHDESKSNPPPSIS